MSNEDVLSGMSMSELFRIEAEAQCSVLTDGLLALESGGDISGLLESLMRAAHSMKGAARIVELDHVVKIAHRMEDCFVAAQNNAVTLTREHVDTLLSGVDMLVYISKLDEADSAAWADEHGGDIDAFVDKVTAIIEGRPAPAPKAEKGAAKKSAKAGKPVPKKKEPQPVAAAAGMSVGRAAADVSFEPPAPAPAAPAVERAPEPVRASAAKPGATEQRERMLRISPEQINQLLGIAGEIQMKWQWLRPFNDSMQHMRRVLSDLEMALEEIATRPADAELGTARIEAASGLMALKAKASLAGSMLTDRLTELEVQDRSIFDLSQRLYHQTISSRMQPFASGVQEYKRMVRDLARSLGKQARLEISGSDTLVDRDILEKMEAPLNHLIRNAVDHGLEDPDERTAAGKSAEGTIRLEAVHQSGMLKIIVSDDGSGIDYDSIKDKVVERGLSTREMVDQMTEAELSAFLFLPKFTMKDEVSEISGRGVGLDVVSSAVNEVRGVVHTYSEPGKGTRFELQLPITLSVLRSLLVEIAGETYAFPLARIDRVLRLERREIEHSEGRNFITFDGHNIGLVSGAKVLGLEGGAEGEDGYHVVLLGGSQGRYGLIVDRFIGELDLVEKVLDARLGKVQDIGAAALTPDGSPVLIIDVGDMLRSIEKMVMGGSIGRSEFADAHVDGRAAKRVLVVDDSITVREVERKLLASRGYEVEVAVDGMDGWNALRSGSFDLVISDVDMPRMDGIELVRHLKGDAALKDTPVIIVSYKESDDDRMRGLDAGADSYLTKSSFHDETLLEVVTDLIGEARP